MPVVSAAGEYGPSPLLPCRDVPIDGTGHAQTLTEFLPTGALVSIEPSTPGVNGDSFYRGLRTLPHLLADRRKVLLTYDAYRSHTTIKVLEHLRANGMVVYALPAHTFGKTQPCDTGVFRTFKKVLNTIISKLNQKVDGTPYDIYELCSILARAFRYSFTARNIVSAFAKSGLYPLDPSKVLSDDVHDELRFLGFLDTDADVDPVPDFNLDSSCPCTSTVNSFTFFCSSSISFRNSLKPEAIPLNPPSLKDDISFRIVLIEETISFIPVASGYSFFLCVSLAVSFRGRSLPPKDPRAVCFTRVILD